MCPFKQIAELIVVRRPARTVFKRCDDSARSGLSLPKQRVIERPTVFVVRGPTKLLRLASISRILSSSAIVLGR